jgi:hypothetical protein
VSCTKNILSTLVFASSYVRFQPLAIGGQDPALTAANMVLDTILGPPFAWKWNRSATTFTCTAGLQDYTEYIPDFAFAELASVADENGANTAVTLKSPLALDGSADDRPAYLSQQTDDNAGTIGFRVQPPPDEAYVVTVTYQRKPVAIQSLAGYWAPVPDEYQHIYNWGFLAMAAMLVNDPRMPMYSQKFVGHLLGAQSGLTEREINIFMSTYLMRTGQVAVSGLSAQQGVTARTF